MPSKSSPLSLSGIHELGTAADPLVLSDSDDIIEITSAPATRRANANANAPKAATSELPQTPANHLSHSEPQIKESPSSADQRSKLVAQARNQLPKDNTSKASVRRGSLDYQAEEMGMVRNRQTSPHTPSKQSSRGTQSSQKTAEKMGSSSPLILRLREQRSKIIHIDTKPRPGHPSPSEIISRAARSRERYGRRKGIKVEDLEESLRRFDDELKDDHALAVRWLLNDAREALAQVKSQFMDKVSPFDSMETVQILAGDPVPQGLETLKMESYANKKKIVKSRSQLIIKTITNDVLRVPKYSAHTTVKRNILSGDDEKLKFIPFLGDANDAKTDAARKRVLKELEEAYGGKRSGSSRESERASQIRTYIDVWLQNLDIGCDQNSLILYTLDQGNEELGLRSRERKMIIKSLGTAMAPELAEMAEKFSKAFRNVFHIPLNEVILPDERLKELVESAQKIMQYSSEEQPVVERLETYTSLTCLICHSVCCQTHGDYNNREVIHSDDSDDNNSNEQGPGEYLYTHERLIMPYEDILRKHDIRRALENPELNLGDVILKKAPCSDHCYLIYDSTDREYEWSADEIARLANILISMKNTVCRPCDISFLLDQPCWQVQSEIEKIEPRNQEPPLGRGRRPDWYDNRRKTLKGDWMDMTAAHLHQERFQTNPCAHTGPCLNECPCFTSNLLCESMCGCPDDCPRKFTGCSCVSAGITCVSDTCICIQMNRECGPECSSCGAIARIDPANRYDDELFTTGCQNVVLQRRVSRKLMIGESQLEGVGFGLYVGEPMRKGDFLSEYAGEVISFAEADRRGIIYDRKYLSFLFDLNSEWCIDAARFANRSRFINHADNEKDGLNCEAKIFLVNGEHRIKFVALRDIAVGEELLFNYGKKFAEKHGLSKKLPKIEEGGKKGVVVGEEALEALDGLDGRNRFTRGKNTAIRGGHNRVGKMKKDRNARKTAPTNDVTAAETENVVEAGEAAPVEDDEYDTDSDVRDGRRKRKITRPLRYTR